MEELKQTCPCKRVRCKNHGNCDACRVHHNGINRKTPICDCF